MGSRDHSYECEVCGLYRGGMNDLRCDCDGEDFLDEISRERRPRTPQAGPRRGGEADMPTPRANIAGQRFAMLTALRRLPDGKWLCRCDCGRDAYDHAGALRFGKRRSCGCARTRRYRDLTGQRFGRLVALYRVPGVSPTRWMCRCDCGAERAVMICNLRPAGQRSCGCARRCA